MGKKLKWNHPEVVPDVKEGTEKLFWIAVYSDYTKKDHVHLAYYQNRPIKEDSDDCLEGPDGETIESVGWVESKEHEYYDSYFLPIHFSEQYRLFGWAKYKPPEFTGCEERPT